MTAAAALAFASAALAVAGIAPLVSARARARGGQARPLLMLARLGARFRGARPPRDLDARIAAAGAPAGLGAREVMAAKLVAALAAVPVGLVAGAAAPGRLGIALAAAAPAAGFLAPDLWLARLASRRARAVRRELPSMLDLLALASGAGLSPAAAIGAVGERATGALAREWRAVARENALGVPLRTALACMAERLPLPEVIAFAAALERAGRHGVPLAEVLAAQARDARFARRRRIQEEAARAGPKIQLVVAALLVPSVLLLVAAALAAALLRSGGGLLPLA